MKKYLLLILCTVVLSGCANRMESIVRPEYRDKTTPVSSIGLSGDGASVAFEAFVEKGYEVFDLPGEKDKSLEDAKLRAIPFLATIDPIGTEGSWRDGVFDFSMSVTEIETGAIVWSATAEYRQGRLFFIQVKSPQKAMYAMVEDFSRTFPPVK